MYRKDFFVDDQHFYVDVFMDRAMYLMTVTVEDENEEVVKEKTFEFDKEKEAKEFIEDLKEERVDLL